MRCGRGRGRCAARPGGEVRAGRGAGRGGRSRSGTHGAGTRRPPQVADGSSATVRPVGGPAVGAVDGGGDTADERGGGRGADAGRSGRRHRCAPAERRPPPGAAGRPQPSRAGHRRPGFGVAGSLSAQGAQHGTGSSRPACSGLPHHIHGPGPLLGKDVVQVAGHCSGAGARSARGPGETGLPRGRSTTAPVPWPPPVRPRVGGAKYSRWSARCRTAGRSPAAPRASDGRTVRPRPPSGSAGAAARAPSRKRAGVPT